MMTFRLEEIIRDEMAKLNEKIQAILELDDEDWKAFSDARDASECFLNAINEGFRKSDRA